MRRRVADRVDRDAFAAVRKLDDDQAPLDAVGGRIATCGWLMIGGVISDAGH